MVNFGVSNSGWRVGCNPTFSLVISLYLCILVSWLLSVVALCFRLCFVFWFASSDFLMVFFHVFDFSRGFLVRAERSDVSVSWFIPFFVWHNAN